MPELRWRKRSGAILPAGSWKPGKETVLGSDEFIDPPGNFTICRRPGPVMRRFRERQGKSPLIEIERLKAPEDPAGSKSARSEPWTLPTPPGLRLRWRLLFEDDQLHRSPILDVSRLATMTPTIGAGVPIPHLPGAEATLGIGMEIIASVDPMVELTVMTPWGQGDDNLHAFLREIAEDSTDEGEDPQANVEKLSSYLGPHLPDTEPEGWQFTVPKSVIEIPEGDPVETLVMLRAPTRGSTAFAVQMKVLDGPDDLVSASDLLVIEVPEDRARASLLFGGDRGPSRRRILGEMIGTEGLQQLANVPIRTF